MGREVHMVRIRVAILGCIGISVVCLIAILVWVGNRLEGIPEDAESHETRFVCLGKHIAEDTQETNVRCL